MTDGEINWALSYKLVNDSGWDVLGTRVGVNSVIKWELSSIPDSIPGIGLGIGMKKKELEWNWN